MKQNRFIIYVILVLSAFFCQMSDGQPVSKETSTSGGIHELPLPHIPDSITGPVRRADYLTEHFWDTMDFTNEQLSLDTLFMEQNFVNFIQLYNYGSENGIRKATRKLMKKAEADKNSFLLLCYIAERYLYDPNSPMRCEEHFILFLQEIAQTMLLTDYERLRYTYLIEEVQKNRPGMIATDFAYISREGDRRTLHQTPGKRILLLFYDPECGHCSEILQKLHASSLIQELIANKELTVLAIYTEDNRSLWDKTNKTMPQEWYVGIDADAIQERELYALPAMPVIYLLDKDKKVLLKDPSPTLLEIRLNEEISRTATP